MINPGEYNQDQLRQMGLDFNEVTSAQIVNGQAYKLDDSGHGTRILKPVALQGNGQGSGGFTTQTPTAGAGTGIGGAITGFNQPTIDLPGMYKNLYDNSGINQLQADLSAKDKARIDAIGIQNDNPFLSESTRVGRVAKIENLYNERTANIKNDIATKKADIETQMNLQTKQFDINSQQAQLAMQQFNTLLSSGALDNASGEDIAAITRATGMSSSMIQSAIQASINAKKKEIPTSMVSFDDGTNTGFALVNTQTGQIISKQTVAASKPKEVSTAKATESEQKQYYISNLKTDAQKGATLSQIFSLYGGYLDPNLIYQLYNANSKYGADSGKNKSTLRALGVKI